MDSKEYLKEERAKEWRAELRKELKTKDRATLTRTEMPTEPAAERSRSYVEVNCGLTEAQAINEASRCIDCPDPTCISGCPVEINIPKFISNLCFIFSCFNR